MSTGFVGSDAKDDFDRARRRQVLARAARTVAARGRATISDDLIPLAEVERSLGGRVSERPSGLRTVPVSAIVGTVDRSEGFDRRFLPTSSKGRLRWERIARAVRRGETLPPVELYRLGDLYYVIDGHHRVSVAAALGLGEVDANVTELRTRTPATGVVVSDLAALARERGLPPKRRRRRPPPTPDG